MHSCPCCGSDATVSNGSVRGVRRRKCKSCGFLFTRSELVGKPLSVKLMAVALYLHGVSMNAIAKWTGVSTPAVLKWIRNHAREHCPKPTPGEATIVELDEMWHLLEKTALPSSRPPPSSETTDANAIGLAASIEGRSLFRDPLRW